MSSLAELLREGVLRGKLFSGTAAATSLDFQPSAGCAWLLVQAWGYHDDNGVARSLNWQVSDGVNTALDLLASGAIANDIYVPFYVNNYQAAGETMTGSFMVPIALTVDTKLTLVADGMGAGKKLYIKALYYELRGVGTWVND